MPSTRKTDYRVKQVSGPRAVCGNGQLQLRWWAWGGTLYSIIIHVTYTDEAPGHLRDLGDRLEPLVRQKSAYKANPPSGVVFQGMIGYLGNS